jgi:transcriptional regulator with XRE-family HTH domain
MAFTVQINPFGEWLKTKREARGLSIQALAEKAGNVCSASYLAQIETDYYFGEKGSPMKPEEAVVEKLAKALDEPLDEARKAAGYLPSETLFEEDLNGELQNVLHKYKQLSIRSREFANRHFTEMLEFLLEFENTPAESYEPAAAEENFNASNDQTEKPEILPEKEIKRRGIKPIKIGELKKKTP